MTHRHPTARLFVAVDPPEQVCDALAAWARTAARAVAGRVGEGTAVGRASARETTVTMRVLDPELLHVTICFLGNRPVQDIPALADDLAACERPAVRLSVGAPIWLPPRRPRALAVELHDEDGALARIQAQLAAGFEPPDEQPHAPSGPSGVRARPRRFRPHVTVARLRSDVGKRSRGHPHGHRRGDRKGSEDSEPALPPTPALSFVPAELVLYRSWLSEQGASYEALASCPIG